jgi:hypothetical protein
VDFELAKDRVKMVFHHRQTQTRVAGDLFVALSTVAVLYRELRPTILGERGGGVFFEAGFSCL